MFFDVTIFINAVVSYFAQTEQKNVSNNKHLHWGC